MKPFLILASVLVALALPSCLQNETTIHLNKDGSGTLVEETTFGAQAVAMFSQLAAMGGEAAPADPLAELFSEEKAKSRAAKLGDGVTFEKTEPLTRGANRGGRVTYRFADINTLKIAPGEGLKDSMPQAQEAAAKAKPITFTYVDGKLTMKMPEPEATPPMEGSKPAAQPDPSPQEIAMMKQMMGDMTMKFKIVAEPGIKSTNATHHEGNTVTVMEMEMGKLLENPKTIMQLRDAGQSDASKAMEIMKGVPGVKVETQKEVVIQLD